MNIQKVIKEASNKLKRNNIKTSSLDSEILMTKAIGKNKKYLILNSSEKIDKKNLNYFNELVNQRYLGKPIAYLIGKKNFWKHEFLINEDVLIPRPDSEIIVEEVQIFTK